MSVWGGTRYAVWEFIQDYMEASNGVAPTVREIGDAVNLSSTSNVVRHLIALEAAGLIERIPGESRGIRIVGAVYTTPRLLCQLAFTAETNRLEALQTWQTEIDQQIEEQDSRISVVEANAESILRANHILAGSVDALQQAAEDVIDVAVQYGFDPNGKLGLADWLELVLRAAVLPAGTTKPRMLA